MAIKLNAAYSKKLGLPGFSSHSYLVSAEVELTDLGQVQSEVTRLYTLLQNSVDREMQHPGFVPDDVYGIDPPVRGQPRHHQPRLNGSGSRNINGPRTPDDAGWRCTGKQRELILRLVEEYDLDRHAVDELAQDRFGLGVRQLNKLQASGLIDELLEKHGNNSRNGSSNGRGRGRQSEPRDRKGAST